MIWQSQHYRVVYVFFWQSFGSDDKGSEKTEKNEKKNLILVTMNNTDH